MTIQEGRQAALLAEYAEVNNNFRLLTDIRFKLLAFLPLLVAIVAAASGTSRGDNPRFDAEMLVLCVFGLIVTVALATYNARNDQIYVWLVERGAHIERELGLVDGSFGQRPNTWLDISFGLGRWRVGHSSSVALMYSTATAVWLAGCLIAAGMLIWGDGLPPVAFGAAVALALILVTVGRASIRARKAKRRREIVDAAKVALKRVHLVLDRRSLDTRAIDSAFVDACLQLTARDRGAAAGRAEIVKRIAHYSRLDDAERALHGIGRGDAAADVNYLTLIVDLPASMLLDGPLRR
jgi:hypothetical protein